MSICNVYVEPERAIVLVDSLCTNEAAPKTPIGNVQKLFVFKPAAAVMAVRGYWRMACYLRGYLGDGGSVQSLDRIDEVLPAAFDQAQERFRSEATAAGVELTSPHAVRIVGFSERMQTMACIAFEQVRPGQRLDREWFNDGLEVAPWHDDQGPIPNVKSADDLLAIGVQQVDFARNEFGALATVGGPLVLVEVSRAGVPLVVRVDRALARGWG